MTNGGSVRLIWIPLVIKWGTSLVKPSGCQQPERVMGKMHQATRSKRYRIGGSTSLVKLASSSQAMAGKCWTTKPVAKPQDSKRRKWLPTPNNCHCIWPKALYCRIYPSQSRTRSMMRKNVLAFLALAANCDAFTSLPQKRALSVSSECYWWSVAKEADLWKRGIPFLFGFCIHWNFVFDFPYFDCRMAYRSR